MKEVFYNSHENRTQTKTQKAMTSNTFRSFATTLRTQCTKFLSAAIPAIILATQVLGFSNFSPITVNAASPGPFWSWNGSGTPTKIEGTENLETIFVGEFPWAAASDVYYFGIESGTGNVFSWGRNNAGQLGDGTTSDVSTPTINSNLAGVTKIVSGGAISLGLKNDGTVLMWGAINAGAVSTPLVVSGASNIVDVDFNGYGGIAVDSSGTAYDIPWWGAVATPVVGISNIVKVSEGWNTKFALDSAGNVWAWGANTYGSLGDGTTTDNSTPRIVPGLPQIKSISTGLEHVLALDVNGDVWAWGRTYESQVGSGATYPTQNSPIKVAGLPPIQEVIAGGHSSKAIDFNQQVWEWGQGRTGGVSSVPTTLPNPANPSQPMLADSSTLSSNGSITVSKRDLIVKPQLTIIQSSSVSSVVQGGSLTFTISYQNTGNATATGVTIFNTLESQFSIVSCNGASCGYNLQDVNWSLGDVPAGASGTVTLDVNVLQNAAVGNVTNSVTITSNDTTPTSATSAVTITAAPVPGLYITKVANVTSTQRNSNYTYTLTYENTTNADVNNIVITDELDNRLSYQYSSEPNCGNNGQTITCNIPFLAANSSASFDINVQVNNDAAGGQLANTAIITSDETAANPQSGSNLITVDVQNPSGPTLQLNKYITNGSSFNPGDTIYYAIEVTNNKSDYKNITVIDTLDSRLNYNYDSNFSCNISNSNNSTELQCDVGVSANSTETLYFSAYLDSEAAPGDLWNTAVANYYDGENNSASSSVNATIQDNGQGGSFNGSINISQASNITQASSGNQVIYTITTTYTGSSKTLYFSNNLDSRFTNISCDNGCSVNGQNISWSNYFNSGDVNVVIISAEVVANAAVGPLANTVIADDQDSSQAPEPRSATTVIQITNSLNPQLSVSKAASQSVVKVGDLFDYTFNYANIGNVDLTSVALTDNLDTRLEFVSSSGCIHNVQLVTCYIGDVTAGGVGTFVVTVRVKAGAASGVLPNTIVGSSDQSHSVSAVTYGRIDDPSPTQGISLTKTANVTTAAIGDQIEYTLQYTNTGNTDLTGAQITDTLDSRFDFVSCSNSCSNAGQDVSWNIGALPAGTSTSVTVTVQVASGAANGIVTNTGFFDTNETPEVSSSAVVTLDTTIVYQPLTITKTSSQNLVYRGSTYTYTINYENPNNEPITNATITDTIDSRLLFGCSNSCIISGQDITWNIGDIAANGTGSVTVSAQVTANAAYGPLSNTAEITSSETSTASSTVFVTLGSVPIQPQPTITKVASVATAYRGDTFTYTINYANESGQDFTNAVISDVIDANLNILSCTGGCIQVGNNVTWTIGNLINGTSGSATITVQLNNNATLGLLANTALLTTTEAPTVSASSYVAVIINDVTPVPSLTLSKSASQYTLNRGDTFTYTLNYANGPTAITNATITDVLNSNLNFVSCSNSCGHVGQNVTWNLGDLTPNQSGSVTVTVQVKPDANLGNIPNTATASSNETSSVNASINVAVIINAGTPQLNVVKTASNDTRAPGESVTYTITYKNTANIPVTAATITDALDARLSFVSCTSGCVQVGQNISWNLGDLADGATGVVTINATISASASTGLINNTALFDSNETLPASSVAAVAVITNTTASLDISHVASNTSLYPGDTFSYTLSYLNGLLPVSAATIANTLDSRLEFVSCSNGCVNVGQNVNWTLGALNAGDSGNVTVTVKVRNNATVGSLDNSVTIDSAETAPQSSTERVAIIVDPQAPYLEVNGSTSPAKAKRGDTVTFTVNYKNPSVLPVTGAVLTIPVGSDLTYQTCSNSCTFDGTTITWNIGSLAAAQTGSVTFTAQVKSSANLGLTQIDLNLNSTEATPTVGKAPVAVVEDIPNRIDLSTTSSTSTLRRGDSFTYTLTYQNNGTSVTNAILTTELDPSLTYNNCTGLCTLAGTPLTWNLGNLAPNQSGSVSVDVTVKNNAPIGALNNTSTITSSQTSSLSTLNTVAIIENNLASGDPRLSISVTSSNWFIDKGKIYQYQIDYQNTSGQTITEAFIKNTLDKRLTLFNCANCTQNGSTLNWSLGTLIPNQSGSITYLVQVTDEATIGILSNVAIFGSKEIQPAGNSTDVSVVVPSPTEDGITVRTGGPEGLVESTKESWTRHFYIIVDAALILLFFSIHMSYRRKKQEEML